MMRFAIHLLGTLLTLGALVLLLVFWLLGTQSGLRWIVHQVPDMIQADAIEGTLGNLTVKDLVVTIGSTQITVSDGSLRWNIIQLLSREVAVNELVLSGIEIALPESQANGQGYTPWQGFISPMDVSVKKAQFNDVNWRQGQTAVGGLSQLKLSGTLKDNQLFLDELDLTQNENSLSLTGAVDVSAKPDGLIDLTQRLIWRQSGMVFDVEGTANGTWSSVKIKQVQHTPIAAGISGDVQGLLSNEIGWVLRVNTESFDTEQLDATFNNTALASRSITVKTGVFDFVGTFAPDLGLRGLRATLIGDIQGGNSMFSQWRVTSDLMFDNLNLTVKDFQVKQSLTSNTKEVKPASLSVQGGVQNLLSFIGNSDEGGEVALSGRWSQLGWPISGANPRVLSDGRFDIAGSNQRYTMKAAANGQLYERPMIANMSAVLGGDQVQIEKMTLRSGGSSLDVYGSIGERLNIDWRLNAPDVGDLVASGSGEFRGSGKLLGLRSAPRIRVTGTSTNLDIANYSIADLTLNMDASLSAVHDVMNIQLDIGSLKQGQKLLVTDLSTNISGHAGSHDINVTATLADQATLNLMAQGEYLDQSWRAKMSDVRLDDPLLGLWSLQDSTSLLVAKDRFSVSASCLKNQEQSICIEAQGSTSSSDISGNLSGVDLTNFNRFLQPYNMRLDGLVDGVFSYSRPVGQLAGVVEGYLASDSTRLTLERVEDGERLDKTLNFTSFRTDIQQNKTLSVSLDAILANSDSLRFVAEVSQPFESEAFMSSDVSGQADVSIADLSTLADIIFDDGGINGALQGRVQLSGSLRAPELRAAVELANARTDIPELGLQLSDISLIARSDGSPNIALEGQLKSGEGILKLKGSADLSDINSPGFLLSLSGDGLQLANTAELLVNGNLNLTVGLESYLLSVEGDIKINSAKIDYQLPEAAVVASGDVILKGEQASPARRLRQRINISVDLGDDMHIYAKGLDADLGGKLVVSKEPEGILIGEGQINVYNGHYRAYGQDLKIDQGRLIFSGGSIDDPSLDLQAEKNVGSITAGVSVTGRASSPVLDLYSSPSLQDEDILSVLVFGKSVNQLGSQDALTLLRIANALRGDGTSKVDQLTQKLQDTLGLSSLELQVNDNAPSLVAGKQLSSRFYVGYGYGLLDAAQSLILRYQINKAWSIKSDLGADSGADLRYQIER